ncbi:substrate-binding domain-containing protein [Cellulomonas sp. URHD0024]|uniref:sugar ABC transporter substrate-binding protein n=1 Tax=Cellulomonas sp. URHD0024 TaxID=1302620 RepID=UPI00041462D5|nr:substrate-binding domain-containing protein [Cellulomonas sp. URHD0024]
MSNRVCARAIAAILAATAVLCGAACSSPSQVVSDQPTASPAATPESTASNAAVALENAYAGKTGAPPTVPTVPPKDIDLWVISCGQQAPSCATPVAASQEAAEAAGWTVNVCDGQLNPEGWGSCVRQAIGAGANVIIPIGIDCISIQQPFVEAKAAGVTVVGGGGADCNSAGSEALWATERIPLEGVNVHDFWNLSGKLAADWIIGKTDGKAKVLQLSFSDPLWGPWQRSAFASEIATCEGCDVVGNLEISNNDLVSGAIGQKFQTALLQADDANAVYIPMGAWVTAGLGQGIVASGRSDQLAVISGFGDASTVEAIRAGAGLDAIVGYSTEWGGWGSVDTAIRVLNGEEVQATGEGQQVIDAEHGLPPTGDYDPGVDFRAAYRNLWGL